MKRILACVAAVIALAVVQPGSAAAQIDCVEKCLNLNPGFGCIPGGQGENCEATVNSCQIDLCRPIPGGGDAYRAADGMLYYAMARCNASPIVVPAHTAVLLVELPERRSVVNHRAGTEWRVDVHGDGSASVGGSVQRVE